MSCFVNKYTDCLIGITIFNTTVNSTNTGTCFFFFKRNKERNFNKEIKNVFYNIIFN